MPQDIQNIMNLKSNQSCNVCNSKPIEMNNIDLVREKKLIMRLPWPLGLLVCTAG